MNDIFAFLFKYRPLLYSKGTLAFRPLWPAWVTAILIIGSLAGSYVLYRWVVARLAGRSPILLAALRATVFLVVVLICLQPVLILHSVIPQKSFVAVAYDVSKSMEIRDGPEGQSRIEVVKDLLRADQNGMLDELNKKFKVRYFRFSGEAARVVGFQDIAHHGGVTDLERSLSQITGDLGAAPVSAVILITDGDDNHSRNLSAAAAQLRARNIPVHTIGIGMPDISKDVEVVRVDMPRKILKDTTLEADISIRSSGYAGRRTKLSIKDRDRVLQSQEIALGSDGEVKTYKLNFSSDMVGPREITVQAEPFRDEIIAENNSQIALLRVEDENPQVLYVEGEPRWTYAFLRRAAEEDKNVRLVTLLRQADGKYLRQGVETPQTLQSGFPTDKAELFRYKTLILGSMEASVFTFDQLRMISDFVSQRGGGFLMVGGKNSFGQGGYINTPMEDLLPVILRFGQAGGATPPFQDLEFKLRLTSYGWDHPVTRVSLSEAENRKRWDGAPSLVGFNPTSGPKPGATVLAQGSVPDARGQSPVILAFQRFGRGKSMALTTASTWRWRMGLESRDKLYESFWKQMLRWLVSDVPDQVNLMTEKNSYSPDESAVIRAEVNDSSYMRLNNAQVVAHVKSPSGQISNVPLAWDVDKEGQYSAPFKADEPGVYEVSAEAAQGSKSLGSAKANFRVGDSNDEFHNASMNSQLLKRISQETGGRYYTPQAARYLPQDISYVDSGSSLVEEKELWDMPFLFLLLAGMISTEWVIRKRNGLA